jgi:hypothetical protein
MKDKKFAFSIKKEEVKKLLFLIFKIVFKVLNHYHFPYYIKDKILALIKEFLVESTNIDYLINPKINRLLIANFLKKKRKNKFEDQITSHMILKVFISILNKYKLFNKFNTK